MIYFASDIHLGGADAAAARATERRFIAWLDHVGGDAEAIVLAGDVFDFWFEKGEEIPDGYDAVLDKLRELTRRGVRVLFFTGNHDMWLNGHFERACGMEVYTEPRLLTLGGRRIFVAHGDNMNIHGKPVLRLLNRCFRSKGLRKVFEAVVPYCAILRLGRWWSGLSSKNGRTCTNPAVIEPLIAYARDYALTHAVDHFVFGHMHYPCDHREGTLHTVHLGGWEQAASYAVLDDEGKLTLKTIEP